MRLKSIKLAGFKSFVDPTVAHFPTNLSAVVGPNGCGKSNVIDAVRWVMGESSAKNLRGESMTDVIFNGSTGRKPVSLASIELVFDNSDGGLGGEYAAFSEISIKRLVTRDARSDYFLNGTRCRRKDITDIFLGTGLGPRSYAIIEQGMISRLIEARPEELRVYIEEAAGISRYKERRRDTETRMRHTRENLERLSDIREELDRQLQHLERQAQSAEKYREYKQEELQIKADLLALRWRVLQQQAQSYEAIMQQQTLELESVQTTWQHAESQLEIQRLERREHADRHQRAQQEYYRIGSEISRLEQQMQHLREREIQLNHDLQEAETSRQQALEHVQGDSEELEVLLGRIVELEPELVQLQTSLEERQQALMQAERAMAEWQQGWEAFNSSASQHRQQAEVQQSRLQQLEQSLKRARERWQRLQLEQADMAQHAPEEDVELLEAQMQELHQQQDISTDKVEDLQQQVRGQRDANHALGQRLDQRRQSLQQLKGRLASLLALQQAALGENQATLAWQRRVGESPVALLAEKIQVNSPWEKAVEAVLGPMLQAMLVDGKVLESFSAEDMQQGQLSLVHLEPVGSPESWPEDALAHQVMPSGLGIWLGSVRCAASVDDAIRQRDMLAPGTCWVTTEGLMVGQSWVQWRGQAHDDAGILQRQHEIAALQQTIAELQEEIDQGEEELQEGREHLAEQEQAREDAARQAAETSRQRGLRMADLSAKQVRLEQSMARRQRIQGEMSEVQLHQQGDEQAYEDSRHALDLALEHMAADAQQREILLAQRDGLRQGVELARQVQREARDALQSLTLQLQQYRSREQAARRAAERAEENVRQLQDRCEHLRQLLMELEQSPAPREEALQQWLQERVRAEEQVAVAADTLAKLDAGMQKLEQQRTEAGRLAQGLRDQLTTQRLAWQDACTRQQTLVDQLQELGWIMADVEPGVAADAEESLWQERLDKLGQRIQRLGAINLAAIDEYQQHKERKTYLDAQNADLEQALETLENAIRKIDRETRTLFKDTFDRVNQGFQALFPKVFGGGHAYIELTGDDLLEAGVAIMARPPGKRNSTIHLLSGGEKALTALSLVFSIFSLNPAPFCMLDEVDAPLDDANVGRFARLVEEMSEQVQFIYITHNKLAMEMAHQLMGVTMHEPGVSRLVSVNVEEAARLAAE
ncbi:MAG: chromosome segregation protein SMC [Pseudomonadales bacterium]|nr:chromosome segregation protein SMC [Pseudomonadales bacterium]